MVFNRYVEGNANFKNSRIDTLCDSLEIHDRRYINEDKLEKQLMLEINYERLCRN